MPSSSTSDHEISPEAQRRSLEYSGAASAVERQNFSSIPKEMRMMSSLLSTEDLSEKEITSLFRQADEFVDQGFPQKTPPKIVSCLFFEPSTRTRMSFQTAAYRLGHRVLTMEMAESSLTKGETQVDTVLNVAAMNPDVIVLRYGNSPELDALLPTLDIPVVNGGSGTKAHPTQALLDAYTLHREFAGAIRGRKILIVGDIVHSRVAFSNFDVLAKLGAEIGVCGPEALLPAADAVLQKIQRFTDLDQAIEWADVYMGLRIQLERHQATDLNLKSMGEYHQHFGLTPARLQKLKKNAIIMHPGPINHGVEFAYEVGKDPRSRVFAQVTNGVAIRAAVLAQVLTARQERSR
jgi:aspartate carbamoyltransferase catalytic subunit